MLSALPMDEVEARAMVSEVTPHSFRPGLARDLLKEGRRSLCVAVGKVCVTSVCTLNELHWATSCGQTSCGLSRAQRASCNRFPTDHPGTPPSLPALSGFRFGFWGDDDRHWMVFGRRLTKGNPIYYLQVDYRNA